MQRLNKTLVSMPFPFIVGGMRVPYIADFLPAAVAKH